MKLFGWKSGREDSRPVLSRVGATRVPSGNWGGDWAQSYEAQVREGYAGNVIVQRSVRLVADGLGEAPLRVSSPELAALIAARSGGQALLATLAAQLLLHGNAFVAIDVPLSARGVTIRVIASGIGDVAGPANANAAVQGISVVPPAPVHLTGQVLPGGDMLMRWTRRSRGGWRWIDGVDAPLAEEREAYRVTISPVGAAVRVLEVGVPEIVVPAADRSAGPVVIAVRQIGSNGESAAAGLTLPML